MQLHLTTYYRLHSPRRLEGGTDPGHHQGTATDILSAHPPRAHGQLAPRKENAIGMGVSFCA